MTTPHTHKAQDQTSSTTSSSSATSTHEPDAVYVRALTLTWVCIAACVGLCLISAGLLTHAFTGSESETANSMKLPATPPDRVDNWIKPGQQLHDVQAQWDAHLNQYRWIDREKKIVAIPIEQAMRILVEHDQRKASPQKTSQNESSNTTNTHRKDTP